MALQPGVALVEDTEQHVAALAARGCAPAVLLVVHAPVHDAERLGDAGCLLRKRDRAVGSGDLEPGSLLFERHRCGSREGIEPLRAHARQDAELVTADAVDLAFARDGTLFVMTGDRFALTNEDIVGDARRVLHAGERHQDYDRAGEDIGEALSPHRLHAGEDLRVGAHAHRVIIARDISPRKQAEADLAEG